MSVPELLVLEALAAANGGELPGDHPITQALVAAGCARLAGQDVGPLAVEPNCHAVGADVAAVCGGTLWRYPDPDPPAA